jgi:hypothetical protein
MAELESRRLLSNVVVASSADSGPGSLRAAIESAVPGEVITFANSLRGQTIALASPLLVDTSLTVSGFSNGPTISGNGVTEILMISKGASVNLTTLTIANGNATRGGAIDNAGNLTIKSSALSSNVAIGSATTAGAGGAIYNETGATLTIINSTLSGNEAIDGVASGGTASGGAVECALASTTSLRGSTFSSNFAISSQGPGGRAMGGAIDVTLATVAITNSRFVGNLASGFSLGQSGAINNSGGVTIRGSVFTSNRATATGLGGSADAGAVGTVGSDRFIARADIAKSSFNLNQAIAFAGGDGTVTMSSAMGGALRASGAYSAVNVNKSSFIGNQAIAATPSSSSAGNVLAGIAVGGAIENDSGARFSVATSVIKGNTARGGAVGPNGTGGAAFGGGAGSFNMNINNPTPSLALTNTSVIGNSAQGGGGTLGDGEGGGIADMVGMATLTGVSLTGNRASGAASADGSTGSLGAGGALLAGINLAPGTSGIFPGGAEVTVSGGSMTGNTALGGSGTTAGDGQGGGMDVAAGGNVKVKKTKLAHNTARGGLGSTGGQSGNGSGGGAFAADETSLQFVHASIKRNLAAGGPVPMGILGGAGVGGGLYDQPTSFVFVDAATPVIGNSATTHSGQIFGPFRRT